MTLRARVVDAVFDGLELVASLYDWIRELRRPKRGPSHDGDTLPIPLVRREQRPEIPPPRGVN